MNKIQTIFLIAVAAIAGAMSSPTTTPQAADGPGIKWVTEELNPATAGVESYKPHADAGCQCDCPNANEIRSIVREELQSFRTQFAIKHQSPSPVATGTGSTGGSLSTAGGSTGGAVADMARATTVARSVVCENGQCRTVNGPSSGRTSGHQRWQPIRNLFRR